MKTISFKLVGVSPLMLNNPRTVSPFDDYAKAISSLTSKRRKTKDGRRPIGDMSIEVLGILVSEHKGRILHS